MQLHTVRNPAVNEIFNESPDTSTKRKGKKNCLHFASKIEIISFHNRCQSFGPLIFGSTNLDDAIPNSLFCLSRLRNGPGGVRKNSMKTQRLQLEPPAQRRGFSSSRKSWLPEPQCWAARRARTESTIEQGPRGDLVCDWHLCRVVYLDTDFPGGRWLKTCSWQVRGPSPKDG
jgi:hypothetical protein